MEEDRLRFWPIFTETAFPPDFLRKQMLVKLIKPSQNPTDPGDRQLTKLSG